MQTNRLVILPVVALAVAFAFFSTLPLASAATETVLYSFGQGTDGSQPNAGLIFDPAGKLYGTTYIGGAYGDGTVFQLIPGANGTWTETVLYSFNHKHKGDYNPAAGLILDAAGNLYGTTYQGGAYGHGTVFQLAPSANGTWTKTVLHTFSNNGKDGAYPAAGLTFDSAGNLYGTTTYGGSSSGCSGLGCGTVFELTPGANGKWTPLVLYRFNDNGKDGTHPEAGLIFGATGNLYGTTTSGGASGSACNGYGCGTVFQLTPGLSGRWTKKILHSFNGKNGCGPVAGLTFDGSGNLYGTAKQGGNLNDRLCGYTGCGVVFGIVPGTNGEWTEKVLYSFSYGDGAFPAAGLAFGAAGNLYGTAGQGGETGWGAVFGLSPGTGGNWSETVLYSFSSGDGANPDGGLIFDAAGNLYGTTDGGGAHGGGTVFEITP